MKGKAKRLGLAVLAAALLTAATPAWGQMTIYRYPSSRYPASASYYDLIWRSESLAREIYRLDQQIREVGHQIGTTFGEYDAARQKVEPARQQAEARRLEAQALRQELEQLKRQQAVAAQRMNLVAERSASAQEQTEPMQAAGREYDEARLAYERAVAVVLARVRQTPEHQAAAAALRKAQAVVEDLKSTHGATRQEMVNAATRVIETETVVRRLEQIALEADVPGQDAAARLRVAAEKLRAQRGAVQSAVKQNFEYQAFEQALSDFRSRIADAQSRLTDAQKRQSAAEAEGARLTAEVARLQAYGQQFEREKASLEDRRARRAIELASLQYGYGYSAVWP